MSNVWPCYREGYADPPPPPSFRRGHLYIKDGKCAESNVKSNFRFFRFLDFELFAAKEITIWLQKCSKVAKFTGEVGIGLLRIFCTNDLFFSLDS